MCLYDHCVIFYSISSNNKLVDLNRADVRPQDRVFSSYPIRDIRNNPINVLATGFRERFNTTAIEVHERLEVRESLIGNPQHGCIGG